MLVVCNGAPKSGSTWLYNILVQLVSCEWPEKSYLTDNKKHPCIRPEVLAEFIEREDFSSRNIITKNHLGKPSQKDVLISDDNIYVFDIERDPKDVAVSLYFDECNRHGYRGSFADFYWRYGREEVTKLEAYHDLWRSAGSRSYVTSYEKLKENGVAEILNIAKVLGIEISSEEAGTIQEKTSLNSLRKKYSDQELYKGEKFFRKGVVGDWKNHFTPRLKKDIDNVIKHGIGKFDYHYNLNQIRRWFAWHFRKQD